MLHEPLTYTFQLTVFEGPLDLLLQLIEREELDVTTVSLAAVADQFQAHIRTMSMPDPAQLSAFLVLAARLLLIKSRALLPRTKVADSDEPDDAEELVRQLQLYQSFRQVAALLRQQDASGLRLYARHVKIAAMPASQPPEDSIDVMIAAIQRRLQLLASTQAPSIPLPVARVVTVREMTARILTTLREQEWFTFDDLLAPNVLRVEVLVALWAVLELWKRHAIDVQQEVMFGLISVGRGSQFGTTHVLPPD